MLRLVLTIIAAHLTLFAGCGPPRIDDPVMELATPENMPRKYHAAIDLLRAKPELSEDEVAVLRGMIHLPGYTVAVRRDAFELLEAREPALLKETIELRLPRLEALAWRRELCEMIAARRWTELGPTVARAWARRMPGWVPDEFDRPEYLALAAMYGEENVIDQLFSIFLTSNSVTQQGLRTSCWTLLVRLGYRDRLKQLLADATVPEDDLMLRDLRAASLELGIVPENREEILWVRRLMQPDHETLYRRASQIVAALDQERRAELELRDLTTLVALSMHEPELLAETKDDLYRRVDAYIDTTRRHQARRDRDGYIGTNNSTLRGARDQLSWGDLAAMLMAVRAMRVPEVVDHLFDYADRDLEDTTTELGGVIRLDDHNRFEIIEFHPRIRGSDTVFHAPDAMINAAYGAVFHFHLHAQKFENATYAGPGWGDLNYADNTRANCLVMTFIDRDTLNIDFYRHGRLVVDLGEVHRR